MKNAILKRLKRVEFSSVAEACVDFASGGRTFRGKSGASTQSSGLCMMILIISAVGGANGPE